jgi:hypothetical protein
MAERNTQQLIGDFEDSFVAANTKVEAGNLGAFNAAGELVHATSAAGLTRAGRIEQTVDNIGGPAQTVRARHQHGVFGPYANKVGDLLTVADLNKAAYFEDSVTLKRTAGTSAVAGRVVRVTSAGVWIDTRIGLPA